MVYYLGFEFNLIWIAIAFLIYNLFFVWIIGKIEKKFEEKKQRIEELEKELYANNKLIKEIEEKDTKEKDFIDTLLESSKKFNDKFESKEKNKIEKNRYQRGKEFEWQVCHYFKKQNYEIDNRSARLGIKDKGIDILAKKDNIYTLIQCKNFAPTTKIKHKLIKEFNSNCIDFVNRNSSILNNQNTKFLFVLSNYESLENCALYYLNDINNKCEYLEIKYIKE